jgi:hypothetical protein
VAESSDRIALPIRVHDFLLALAGRIDDDALTDARELLAVAELDRAVDLLTASLVAGRIPLAAAERDELRTLVDAVRSAPALVDRVIVNDNALLPRHRFTTGVMDDPAPDTGVLDAIGRVIEVLPDIRALSCVWRATPAGVPAGPVPQRVVLVETGPDGFAPSTAYRVEQSLRRAGIRASVEVIQAGTDVTEYHADALAVSRRVPLRQVSGRGHDANGEPGGSLFTDSPTPRTVTSTRRRYATGAHAEKRSTVDASTGRWQPRIAHDEAKAAEPEPDPVKPYEAATAAAPVAEPTSHVAVAPVEPEPAPALPELALPEPAADADLSSRERELLRQLHQELAKREGESPEEPGTNGWSGHQRHSADPTATSPEANGFPSAEFNSNAEFSNGTDNGGEFNPGDFGGPAWHQSSAEQTAVNGIPPYGGGQG